MIWDKVYQIQWHLSEPNLRMGGEKRAMNSLLACDRKVVLLHILPFSGKKVSLDSFYLIERQNKVKLTLDTMPNYPPMYGWFWLLWGSFADIPFTSMCAIVPCLGVCLSTRDWEWDYLIRLYLNSEFDREKKRLKNLTVQKKLKNYASLIVL